MGLENFTHPKLKIAGLISAINSASLRLFRVNEHEKPIWIAKIMFFGLQYVKFNNERK